MKTKTFEIKWSFNSLETKENAITETVKATFVVEACEKVCRKIKKELGHRPFIIDAVEV